MGKAAPNATPPLPAALKSVSEGKTRIPTIKGRVCEYCGCEKTEKQCEGCGARD